MAARKDHKLEETVYAGGIKNSIQLHFAEALIWQLALTTGIKAIVVYI